MKLLTNFIITQGGYKVTNLILVNFSHFGQELKNIDHANNNWNKDQRIQ